MIDGNLRDEGLFHIIEKAGKVERGKKRRKKEEEERTSNVNIRTVKQRRAKSIHQIL